MVSEMKLPCEKCKGQCCTFAPFSKEEYQKVKDKIPEGSRVLEMIPDAYVISQAHNDMCAF